jgi:hypothetical protein
MVTGASISLLDGFHATSRIESQSTGHSLTSHNVYSVQTKDRTDAFFLQCIESLVGPTIQTPPHACILAFSHNRTSRSHIACKRSEATI